MFYDKVIRDAEQVIYYAWSTFLWPDLKIEQTTPLAEDGTVPEPRVTGLEAAASALVNRLMNLCKVTERNQFMAIVYFDEAHTLQETSNGRKSPYTMLMHALSTISTVAIFFVFLSTNSSLNAFAPMSRFYPSIRVKSGEDLIHPFIELPFDTFYRTSGPHSPLTLDQACKLDHIVKAGRPM